MRLWLLINDLTTSSNDLPVSNSVAISSIALAKIAFRIVFGPATDWLDPTARNSNLFPVKAKGEVRLRSVLSFEKVGTTETPVAKRVASVLFVFLPSQISSIKASSSSPKNIEIIAGGASLAPKRWSLPALAILMRNKSEYSSTALIVQASAAIKDLFLAGLEPGSNKFIPVFVITDQLSCLPEPFTPAKGFSCNKQRKPCFLAISCISCINKWLLSVVILTLEYTIATSCCAGATSLCLVFEGIPYLQSSWSKSFIKAATLRLRLPK